MEAVVSTLSSLVNPVNEEVCLVCQDASTGYHYGVPSCNGCKTFFRRTIMKKQVFICQLEGNCPVDKSIRCACRHCRFKKCIDVGMDRNAIQQNRDPIGYTKRTRRYPIVKQAIGSDESSPKQNVMEDSATTAAEDEFLQCLADIEGDCGMIRRAELRNELQLVESVCGPCKLRDPKWVEENSKPSSSVAPLRQATQMDYATWHERDWCVMIEWAKTIPAYQNLPLSDKLSLLRHSAITFPSLLASFFTPDHGPDVIVLSNGAFFDRTPEPTRPLGFNKKKFQMLDQLLAPMRKLTIDVTEFSAFKAIFFLNPDADDLVPSSKHQLSEGRSSITNALYRYMIRKRGTEEAGDRFGRLLLLGTVLATMAVEMKEAVTVADFFDQSGSSYPTPFQSSRSPFYGTGLVVILRGDERRRLQWVAGRCRCGPNSLRVPSDSMQWICLTITDIGRTKSCPTGYECIRSLGVLGSPDGVCCPDRVGRAMQRCMVSSSRLFSALAEKGASASSSALFTGQIPHEAITKSFVLSSGPGGQNVQKNATKAQIKVRLGDATWLDAPLREAVVKRLANRMTANGDVVIESDRTRERNLNLADCLDKLRSTIYEVQREMTAREETEEDVEVLRKRAERAARARLAEKRDRSMRQEKRAAVTDI